MKELSVFIDESGDFGEVIEYPAYYLVTLSFHDQKNNIMSNAKKLEESIKKAGFIYEYIHTGPIIRREEVFSRLSIDERRKLLFIKKNENRLSKSEKLFFYKPQELKKNFFRTVDKKRLTSKV